jgi:ABC-2 type transport system ATP-binding protein
MSKRASSNGVGIQATDLTVEFKGGVRAVAGIDLQVSTGEIYGFLGPNGAGKSTTVLTLTTLLRPTSGQALVGGYDVVRQAGQVRQVIGAALQEVALDQRLSPLEHLYLQAALHGQSRARAKARAEELLARVGLTAVANRKAGTFSGGMRRRLDLALALVHGPSILFLDEPTTGLDIQSRSALWEEVRHLARDEGVTVFLTTQYLEEADVLADRVAVIDHGTIVAEGSPTDLKAEIGRPALEVVPADPVKELAVLEIMVRFGERVVARPGAVAVRLDSGEAALTEVVRALDAEGLAIARLDLRAPTLDDVFLAKTGRSLEGDGQPVETAETDERTPVAAP